VRFAHRADVVPQTLLDRFTKNLPGRLFRRSQIQDDELAAFDVAAQPVAREVAVCGQRFDTTTRKPFFR